MFSTAETSLPCPPVYLFGYVFRLWPESHDNKSESGSVWSGRFSLSPRSSIMRFWHAATWDVKRRNDLWACVLRNRDYAVITCILSVSVKITESGRPRFCVLQLYYHVLMWFRASVCVWVRVCVCACVCVTEREGGRENERSVAASLLNLTYCNMIWS